MTSHAQAHAERWPTADEVEREVYGRLTYRGETVVPKQPRAPRNKPPKPKGLLTLSPVDRRLAQILGGIPQPRPPRKKAA